VSQGTIEQTPALTASQASWRAVMAGDKAGWLALMTDDVVIEDPIGPAYTNPDGTGVVGKDGVSQWWERSVGLATITIACEETFPSSSPDEVAHIHPAAVDAPLDGGDDLHTVEHCSSVRLRIARNRASIPNP